MRRSASAAGCNLRSAAMTLRTVQFVEAPSIAPRAALQSSPSAPRIAPRAPREQPACPYPMTPPASGRAMSVPRLSPARTPESMPERARRLFPSLAPVPAEQWHDVMVLSPPAQAGVRNERGSAAVDMNHLELEQRV